MTDRRDILRFEEAVAKRLHDWEDASAYTLSGRDIDLHEAVDHALCVVFKTGTLAPNENPAQVLVDLTAAIIYLGRAEVRKRLIAITKTLLAFAPGGGLEAEDICSDAYLSVLQALADPRRRPVANIERFFTSVALVLCRMSAPAPRK